MDEKSRLDLALRTFVVAIVLGIAGDLLLRGTSGGAGVTLYAGLIVAGVAFLYRKREIPIAREVQWLALPCLLFAGLFMWRDAPELKLLNSVSLMILIGIIAQRARSGKLALGTIADYPFRLVERWFLFVSDAIPLANLQGLWPQLRQGKNGKTASSVMIGLVLAIPLVLLFGGLFVSADAGFERLVNRTFQLDAEALFSHAVVTLACGWFVAGFLQRLFFGTDVPPKLHAATKNPPPGLGIIEIGIVLGMLDLLFAAFVATQFRNLFGGNEVVQNTANLGYAQYARRGFFELSTVALLVLPVLLGAHSLLRRNHPSAERTFNLLASVLVALVFVVIHSAVLRMRLYVDAYGISQLRIYVLASIGWIGAVFLWFAGTMLRGRSDRFAFGAVMLFLTAVVGLNVANPDGMVARVNLARGDKALDAQYLSALSKDAAPELVKALPNLPADQKQVVLQSLGAHFHDLQDDDWRSWNLSRREATTNLAGREYPSPPTPNDQANGLW